MLIRPNLAAIVAIVSISVIAPEIARSVQLRDGTVSFVQQPRLVATATSIQDTNAWGSTYYFTIDLPQNAGEPLQTVTFNQHEGVDNIRFDLKDTRAFVGTRRRRGENISLGAVTRDKETRTVTVLFNPPVTPGKTITIGLRPVQNPFSSGVYLFGVKAFPVGAKTAGQFMGYGRLQFYGDLFD
ncbi:DUF2808 domain-containing protein [Chlorogloea sp. CCALA 695]|uniref:DUF2808 domain-containing protein n=1 Tax=Chlorogloea sp. CCALA 695 TaxID=2107693 RepID=UPI000D073894|nr:DUF2808 domain-containing protein [Chlorogloea sp. CCALA 695]PSB34503.1 hypothetical protein C7B70_03335 [Chlorogloea sp. CCALA 695]